VKALLVIVWTIVGLVAGAFILSLGIDAREGKAGMFAVFVGAPIGAIAGFMAGLAVAVRQGENRRALGRMLGGTVAGVVAIVLGVYAFETWRTWNDIDNWGGTYSLEYQVRLPAGAPSPGGQKIGMQLFSSKENPLCDAYDYPHGLQQQGDHFVISASCKLRYATADRTIGVRIGEGPTRYFKAKVGRRPQSAVYSDWYRPDQVKDNVPGAQFRAPRPDEIFEIRYSAR
jgi:hypothetical protein